jgi:hypothetical protein
MAPVWISRDVAGSFRSPVTLPLRARSIPVAPAILGRKAAENGSPPCGFEWQAILPLGMALVCSSPATLRVHSRALVQFRPRCRHFLL